MIYSFLLGSNSPFCNKAHDDLRKKQPNGMQSAKLVSLPYISNQLSLVLFPPTELRDPAVSLTQVNFLQ